MNISSGMLRSNDAESDAPRVEHRGVRRACGAIALIDVMKRLGIEVSVEETWARVAQNDPFGTQSAKSFRLAGHAIEHGLQAAVLKCSNERAWDALSLCGRLGFSVIINHQARFATNEGHFSTLVSVLKDRIITDDPTLKAQVSWGREDFLRHWTANDEITGYVLVAICANEKVLASSSMNRCPSCSESLSFQPSELFDPNDWDSGGLWDCFFCPGCDASFSPCRSGERNAA